jgi:hypothetical protein
VIWLCFLVGLAVALAVNSCIWYWALVKPLERQVEWLRRENARLRAEGSQ